MDISQRTIGRLSLYRRLLDGLLEGSAIRRYSHELARLAGVTAAQLRRDLMTIGFTGSPAHGYDVAQLVEKIGEHLDGPESEGVALIGVGNLGRALIAFMAGRHSKLSIVAAFDKDPQKSGRVIHGCRCYSMLDLPEVVSREGIRVAILTVPALEAQGVVDRLVQVGIRGIVNFAPIPISVPGGVTVEHLDITMAIEKVAYFARRQGGTT